jgi:hypothetical protein
MNKVLTSFTLLLLTASAQASENGVARLDVGQGVLLNGKPVKVSQVLQAGELQTDTSHPAEITLLASLAKISLRPGTRLSIAAPEATTGREIETLGAGTLFSAKPKSWFSKAPSISNRKVSPPTTNS